MKITSIRNIIVFFSLLAFLSTGQAGAQGYIWCLGEDGHSRLEYEVSDGCGPNSQQLHQALSCHADQTAFVAHDEELHKTTVPEDHCGPCFDVPASYETTSRRTHDRKDIKAQVDFPVVEQIASLLTYTRTQTTHLYPQPPPRISPTILAHRTVVLLN